MAIKNGNFLRGALGPLIFRVVRGKQRVSVKPEPGTVKQTKKTKTAGKRFGMASSLGAEIRRTFEVNVGTNYDPTVNERLTGVLMSILSECQDPKTKRYQFVADSFSKLEGFDFNNNAKMNQLTTLHVKAKLHGTDLSVEINELLVQEQLKFPANAFRCQLTISMSLLRLKDGLLLGNAERQNVKVNLGMEKLEAQNFNFKIPGGCLCLTTMSLTYSIAGKSGWKDVGSKKHNPSCIIGAFITPGAYQQDSRIRWLAMVKFE